MICINNRNIKILIILLSVLISPLLLAKNTTAALNPNLSQYFIATPAVQGSATSNFIFASLFNPVSSSNTVIIKRLYLQADDAVAAAATPQLTIRMIGNASLEPGKNTTGVLIASSDIPKKNTNSPNSILEVRYGNHTVTLNGTVDSRILSVVAPSAVGSLQGEREIVFINNDSEKLILQPGQGIAVYQEAAGSVNHRVKLIAEWEENATTPTSTNEYIIFMPRVAVAQGTNNQKNFTHVFFNPSGNTKTAVVKRIGIYQACLGTAVYNNNFTLRRISQTDGGTTVLNGSIPKKNTNSANSTMELRYTTGATTVNATFSSSSNYSSLMSVTPCGAASEINAMKEVLFADEDERLIIQPGEGVALVTEGPSSANQATNLFVEWQEVTTVPTSQGEYMFSYPHENRSAGANYTFHSFFNPAGNNKTAVVKRIEIRVDAAAAAATNQNITLFRINAASAGTPIPNNTIPKKHTGSNDSIMNIRSGNVSVNRSGTLDSKLMSVTGPAVVGQLSGRREIVFITGEDLILQPGEGVALTSEAIGDPDQLVNLYLEWDEEDLASTPLNQSDYMITVVTPGTTSGVISNFYNYTAFFNPATSGKTVTIERLGVAIDTILALQGRINFAISKISSAGNGTILSINGSGIPKMNTNSSDSIVQIYSGNPNVTRVGSNMSKILGVSGPTTTGTAVAPQITGYRELAFINRNDNPIILQPGEGFVLYQDQADVLLLSNLRIKLNVEWKENTTAPGGINDYIMSTGNVTGALDNNYVYASFFNPSNSSKNYTVKRLGIRADRNLTVLNPFIYINVTARMISNVSGGNVIDSSDVIKKDTNNIINSTADIRFQNVSVTFSGTIDNRLIGVIAPGAASE